MSRLFRPVAIAAVMGLVVGGATVAAATSSDPCEKVYTANSIARLQDYIDCREDRQDARLKRIENSLKPTPTVSPKPTPSPTSTTTPSVRPTATPTPTASATPTPTPTATATAGPLNLPKMPYAGGPEYWAQFPAAKAAGWTDPNFFPIVLWYGSCSPEQYTFDKAHGVNTYAQCNPETPYEGLRAAGMDTLFTAKGQPAGATTQPGVLLDDEVDGRYSDADGIALLKRLDAQHGIEGRFSYVNYTGGIVTFDRTMANSSAYLNGAFNDVIGLDQYFYSNPQCSWTNDGQAFRYRTPAGQNPIDRSNCRTSSSYGKAQQLLREVDAYDGTVNKPIWAFVEVVSPGGGTQNGGSYVQPTGAQIQAAAWHSIIGGAAGIDWFSNSPDGGTANPCLSGDVMADARLGRGCSAIAPNVEAMGRVNLQIKALAPVLNTPSYRWDFGTGVDTMLKTKDGSAYIFAMTKDGGSGSRTFTLPAGVRGATVEVVNENRSIPVVNGKFTDAFAAETTHHIYRVVL